MNRRFWIPLAGLALLAILYCIRRSPAGPEPASAPKTAGLPAAPAAVEISTREIPAEAASAPVAPVHAGALLNDPAIVTAPRWEPPGVLVAPTVKRPSAARPLVAPPPTSELLIFLKPGTDPASFASDLGLSLSYSLPAVPDAHVFAAATPEAAKAARERALGDPRVALAFLNERTQHIHCAFTPNDPYLPDGSPAGFHGQWHLGNGATATHANLAGAWNRDVTGTGVLLGIVDDCLQTAHPDLSPNYVAADSFNFGNGTGDPNPNPAYDNTANEDRHGTSVSGVAAARGGNGVGVTGAAPLAGLAGLRVDFPAQTTAMFVNATLYHSSAGNTNIKVKNHSYGVSATYIPAPAETAAVSSSAASGTIHLFAAGNERGTLPQDSGKTEPQNNPDAIAVAAIGSDGKFSWYSSFGANVFVTAPSSGIANFGILTTDRIGNRGYNSTGNGDNDSSTDLSYTTTFGGTSSATPLTSGIMALGKQVRPNLNVRFAKHALARSCTQVDPTDGTVEGGGTGVVGSGTAWKTNAAGFKFNQNYGFGMVNADAFVTKLLELDGVTAQGTESVGTTAVGAAIPDAVSPTVPGAPVVRTFSIATTTPVEDVVIALNITHPYRGDIQGFLTSPMGTTARLFSSVNDDQDDIVWNFLANAFWGENPSGTWTLSIQDAGVLDLGTWNSYAVTLHTGTVIADTTAPTVTSINRAAASPTNAASVAYTVTFSEPVTGVNAGDFALATTGTIAGASITSVTGSVSVYTVTVNTGSGDGTIRLDLADDDSIQDAMGLKLGGAGAGNGSFTSGQSYTLDRTVPSVTNVTSTAANGAYRAAGLVPVTVAFAENVTVTGTPRLTLATGGAGTVVNYSSGSGSATLTFSYTVGAGQNSPDLDYFSTSALALNGGTIRDAAGNNAVLTLASPGAAGSLGANKNIVIDTTNPGAPGTPSGAPNPNNTGSFLVSWTAASDGTGSGIASYTVQRSDNGLAFSTIASGVAALSLSETGLAQGSYRYQVRALDAAGNAGGFSGISTSVVVDTTAPTVTINQAAAQVDPTNASPILFTVVFSESVTGFATGDVTLGGTAGATTATVSGSGTTYTVSVSGMTSSGTVIASIGAGVAIDAAGNANAASTSTDNLVLYDITPPSVTINQAAAQADPTNASPILFTVVFSETVTGFATGDVTLSGTAGATTATVSGSGTTYTVSVTGMTSSGTVIASIGAGVAADAVGNLNTASTSTDNTVTRDIVAPTVTINQAVAQADPANASPVLFTVVFSETVTGFATGDVTLGGTAGATTASVSGSGTTYTVSVSGMTGSGTVIASIAAGVATDAAGNTNAASTSTDNTITYDATPPTVTINQEAAQLDPTNASPILFTVVFSETVTGFATGDVTLGGTAGATTATVSGSGTTYTVSVSGMTGSGTVIASVPAGVAIDAAGNANVASTSTDNTVTFDNVAPTVTINQAVAQADPTNASPILFTVVFSESVTGFATGDVSFTGSTVGGTLVGAVSGAGTTYTVSVTGMTGNGTVVASIPAAAAVDGAGNPNAASTSTDNTVTRDITAPTVTINQAVAQSDPAGAASILFTVVFSEAVTGFATGDVTLGGTAGATTATVSGSGTTYTVSVSGMTSTGTVIASIGAGVATDAAGNANAASTSTDNTVTFDNSFPTVTINQAVAQADPTNASPILFTVVFSEAVTGFATGDVTLSGTAGATTATVSGSGTTYTVSVSGMTGSGTVIASIGAGVATDAVGNPNVASTSTDNIVTFDNTPPTVTINQAIAQADPASASPILFTVVFSEVVTNFATGDVTLGGTAGATTATVSGSGTTYTVSVSGMTGSGTVIASIGGGVATDAAGNANTGSTSTDNTVTFDNVAPTVTINQAVAQPDPANASPVLFTVVFSEAVTGFATGDVTLGGTAGATTAVVSGSGTTYTVSVSGMTGSGTVIASIGAGVATDAAGNPNVASTSTDNTVTFDNAPPTVTINQAVAQADPANASPVLFTVVFSEAVTGFATGDVTLGGTAGATTAVVSGSGTTYTVSVSGMTGSGTVIASIAAGVATDAAGNPNTASTSTDNTVIFDNAPPSVTINQAVAQADPTNVSPILFTVVFSEVVTNFATGDVTLGGTAGATTATVSGSGTTYTVSVSGMTGNGTVIASIGAGVATDAAGNANIASTSTDNIVTFDNTAPTVTINQAVAQADPTNASPILFTVVFSESVTGFATGDVTLGGTAGATTAIVSGGGTTYTVSVSGMTSNGTVIASIAAGVATDAAGNASAASTSTDNTVTYDNTPPTVTINQAAAQADPTNASPILFTVVFSEAVTGFATGDVTLGGTAGATTATVSGSGTTYTVSVSGMAGSGTVIASIAAGVATDAVGNPNTASTSTDNTVIFDNAPPTVTINQAGGQTDPTNASPVLFTVVFNETVTGFATGDVTLGGTAGATTATVSGSGTTYTVSVSGMTGSGTVLASIGAGVATDAAGNPNTASTSTDNTLTFDNTPPTVTINQAGGQTDPTNASPVLFAVVFSEAVTGFATGDVTLGGTAGATTATVSGSGTTYTVSVTGMTSTGTVTASIGAGVATDAAGNPNVASTSTDNTVTFDNAPPTVAINQGGSQADPTNASPVLFTVVFSEAVTGFATGDVTLGGTAGATTATVSGSGTTYTVSVSGMTGSGTVLASIGAGVATDAAGNPNVASTSTDNTVTFDNAPPTVTINQAGGQTDPTNASPILFTVVFSESVTGFATGDVTLGGTAGATTATVSGSGTTYTVSVSGMTGNGTVIASIGAGVATDAAGNANVASTSTDNTVTYDNAPPTVTINQAAAQVDPTNATPILFTVVFSETVTGFATGDVTLGGTAGATTATVSGSGTTYTVSVTGMTGSGTVIASIAAGVATDVAGNPNAASTSTDNTVTYDNAPPAVTINQAVAQTDPTNSSPILFTVVFSEAVTGFATGDVTLGGTAGATTATVSGSGTTYTVSVSGMAGSGTVIASIAAGVATDAAGNASAASTSTDNTVTYDNTPPTVTINQAAAQADPTNASPILFTVVFSEAVTGFATGDVTLGGTAGATTATVSGSGTTYTVSVSGMAGSGTVIASIAAGVATDAAGNANAASTSTDNTVTYDNTPPTVTINQAAAQADPTNASPILFTVVFSEAVTGFATGDVTLGGTAGATTATVSGSGTTYTVSVSGMAGSGTVIASIAAGVATDAAGNANTASTSTDNTVTFDNTPPTVTINQAAAQADPTNASPILFTVVFSEAVTGFATGDVTLGGTAGATTATVSGSGTTYTVSVAGMTGNGTVIASIGAGVATDAAGNANTASTSTDNTVTFDNTPPTVTINQAAAQTDPANASPILFTVVFSEAVTGFATGDVTLSGTAGASTATVTGSGTTYTVSVTGMTGSGTIIASIGAGVATDAAGNPNAASTSSDNTVTLDSSAPTVTINQAAAQADPTNASPILFTVVFSEAVTGFATGDVTLGGTAGATTATVSGGPSTYLVTVTGMTGVGTVTATIPAGVATDAAANPSLASTSTDNTVTFDSVAPGVTQVSSLTANGTYGSGATILVTVAFSEPVTVTGVPRLTLETGAADAVVDFTSGSGTSTLLFTYTVAPGHVSPDLDYASAGALALNGGSIRDAAGNNATLALAAPGAPGSLGAARNLVVDTSPPVAGAVNDGWIPPDVDAQLSVTTLSANWSGFSDPESGIAGYEWAIGSTPGGQQILAFSPVGLQTSASTSAVDLVLALITGSKYYVTIRATNGAGLTVTATSDGVTVNGTAASGPAAPLGFWATGGDQAALLDWLPGPGPAPSFYRVWWKPASSPWTQAVRVDPLSGTSASISGLTNGIPYDFMIKAVDAAENESPGVFASATPMASITIGGLGTYGTVQGAIDAAVPGETVQLGPGTYSESLILRPGVSLIGTSPLHTVIQGPPGSPVVTVQGVFPSDPTSTIANLTLTGGTLGVDGGTADVRIHHAVIHHAASHGAASAAGGRLQAVNCTIMHNGGDGIRAQGTAEARNCVVGKNLGAGLDLPAGALISYDNAYGNGTTDYLGGAAGTGNLSAAAIFLDEPANLYIEDADSPTVDAGDPLDAFSNELSPNGARINQGAFGNTRWAASKGLAPTLGGGGGGGGGGCGLLGLEALLMVLFLRRRNGRAGEI